MRLYNQSLVKSDVSKYRQTRHSMRHSPFTQADFFFFFWSLSLFVAFVLVTFWPFLAYRNTTSEISSGEFFHERPKKIMNGLPLKKIDTVQLDTERERKREKEREREREREGGRQRALVTSRRFPPEKNSREVATRAEDKNFKVCSVHTILFQCACVHCVRGWVGGACERGVS